MSDQSKNRPSEPRLSKTLGEDIRHGDLVRTLRRDWDELKEFYLDQDRKQRLQVLGRLKRFFVMSWWLLKALLLRLTPLRRVLLLLGIFLIIQSGSITFRADQLVIDTGDLGKIGSVLLLFVLMLELKDKLLAQSELQAGRSVQRALLPTDNPKVAGWELWLSTRPANEVGGDLVDYLVIDATRLGVVLGDVAGKGLRAALLMVKLQATLRALAADFTSLAELGTKLNTILRRDGLPDSFASMVYVEVRPNSGHLRLLNAGHMPPLLLKDAGITEMPRGAAALGVLAEAAFVEQTIELKRGEILLVYSDGLTEARNEAGTFFGEERLMSLLPTLRGLSAAEIGTRLLGEIDAFVGAAKAHDDLSLIVLRHTT